MHDGDFPKQPAELSDDWLTAVLAGSGVIGEGRVTDHAVQPMDASGLAAETVKVELAYDRDIVGAPSSIVAKFTAPHGPLREVARAIRAYESEVNFYNDFGSDAGIPVPACYHAQVHADGVHFVILMENIQDGILGTAFPWMEEALKRKGIGNVTASDLKLIFTYMDSEFEDDHGPGIVVYSTERDVPSGAYVSMRVWQFYAAASGDTKAVGIHVNPGVPSKNAYVVPKAGLQRVLAKLPRQPALPLDVSIKGP